MLPLSIAYFLYVDIIVCLDNVSRQDVFAVSLVGRLFWPYRGNSGVRAVPSFRVRAVPSFRVRAVPSFRRSVVPSFRRSVVSSFRRSVVPSFRRFVVPSFRRSVVPPFRRFVVSSFRRFVVSSFRRFVVRRSFVPGPDLMPYHSLRFQRIRMLYII